MSDHSNYGMETMCVQSGYTPENGEPRVLPIYQSTTYRYTSGEQLAKLLTLMYRDTCIREFPIRQLMP